MILLWNVRWLFLIFLFRQINLRYVTATWPLLNSSNIQLLGLFPDEVNTSAPDEFTVHSRAMFKAAVLLAQQWNITLQGQSIGWQVVQTGGKAIEALSSTCQATSASNIMGIVGPALSRETPIIADIGNKVGFPVVSYSATDRDLSDQNNYPAFYRTVPSDNAAALAIVQLFLRFNWTSCVIIYQNDAFGSGGAKAITEAFIKNDLIVANTLVFDISTLKMRDNLKDVLTTSATRIVLLWAGALYTPLILQNALDSDVLGPHFTWILSSSFSLKQFNTTYHSKLTGVLTVEPTIANVVHAPINTTLLHAAYDIWKQYEPESFPVSGKVNYYALFAFDATWLLIQSLQKLCSRFNNNSSSPCISFTNASLCFDRRFLNSSFLFDIINNMTFLGVSGLVQFNKNTADRINGNYYFAQNLQSSSNGLNFVPVLNYSDHYGWQEYSGANTIIWPGNSIKPPTGGAKLDGVKLRIGVIESEPFTIVSTVTNEMGYNTIKLSGYVLDLIERLQEKMKFIPIVQLVPANQTYDSLAQAIQDGIYDIIIGDVTVTATRRQNVGFSNPIFDNSLGIIMRKTRDVNIDFFSFMRPFTSKLWLLILFTTITVGILIGLVEKETNRKLREKPIIPFCAMSIWYSFGHLVGYGVDFHVRTAAGRLLTAGLYIFSIVLVASYTANLASELTILRSKNIISGVDDIKSGKIPYNRIGVRVGTAVEEFYLREITDGNRNFYPLKSGDDTYNGLLNNLIDVAIDDLGCAEYAINNIYCNLTLVGEGFDKSAFGIVTPKQWLYAQDLDVNILLLKELGNLDDLKRKWFQGKNCADSTEPSVRIGIDSLIGLFMIIAIICVLSLLLRIWKRFALLYDFPSISRRRKKSILPQSQNRSLSLVSLVRY